jgi:hypothetical protein
MRGGGFWVRVVGKGEWDGETRRGFCLPVCSYGEFGG